MDWVLTAAGALLVAVTLRDVFHTLFHPAGEGSLSRLILSGTWRAFHWRSGQEPLSLAGPFGFVCVITAWTVLLVVGFALLFWPHLDTSFTFISNLEPTANAGFLDAVYFSAVTLATLGYGDITAATTPWRLAAVFEGIVGLALLTAAVSWLLSIYAALQRRRALAGTASAVIEAGTASEQQLDALAAAVQSVRADFTQHSAVYYFHSPDVTLLLPAVLPALAALGTHDSAAARVLKTSVESLARTLGESFLKLDTDDVDAVAHTYANDHRVSDLAARLRERAVAIHVTPVS